LTGRQNRCLLWVVCGVLLVCLAGTELPELLTLTNNTSNDFTTFLSSSKATPAIHIAVVDHQQKDCCPKPLLILNRSDHCFLAILDIVTARSSRDLLELHSFWRT
jgi:hypothetical protein